MWKQYYGCETEFKTRHPSPYLSRDTIPGNARRVVAVVLFCTDPNLVQPETGSHLSTHMMPKPPIPIRIQPDDTDSQLSEKSWYREKITICAHISSNRSTLHLAPVAAQKCEYRVSIFPCRATVQPLALHLKNHRLVHKKQTVFLCPKIIIADLAWGPSSTRTPLLLWIAHTIDVAVSTPKYNFRIPNDSGGLYS